VTTTHEGHAETQEGKPAMTRRSIFSLVTLFVALFVASQVTVVGAHDVCGDPPGHRCVPVTTDNADLFHPASIAAPIGVASGDLAPLRGHEQAMSSLGSANTDVVCPTEPTDRPLCYTLLPDGTKVLAPVPPGSTGP
jgi:hypothetical protein